MNKLKNIYSKNLYDIIVEYISIDFFFKILLISILIFYVFINTIHSSEPLMEAHQFRQTQTALTSYYLKINGFQLNYETPVLGKAWSIPFEFPIYQELVAISSSIFGTTIAMTGRVISALFMLLTAIPIYKILRTLNYQKHAIYIVLSLLYSSPFYLFWSGTFLIETAALFFTFCFLYYGILILQGNWSFKNTVLLGLFLLLALLQKITTIAPILLVFGTLFIFSGIKVGDIINNKIGILRIIIGVMIPVLLSLVWVRYSDILKQSNPIATGLTSESLWGWNFGSLAQRISKNLWIDIIFIRNIQNFSFGYFGILMFLAAILLCKSARFILIILAICYILPFLIFTNLHIIHDYYQISNIIYLLICFSLSIVYILDKFLLRNKFLYIIPVLILITINLTNFFKEYYPAIIANINVDNNRTLGISNYIKNNTPNNMPVIWFGFDWSSEVAFYSERKSLTVPSWGNLEIDTITNQNKYLGVDQASAYVLCPTTNFDNLKRQLTLVGKYNRIEKFRDCDIFFKSTKD